MRRTGSYFLLFVIVFMCLGMLHQPLQAQNNDQETNIDVEATVSKSSVRPGERVALQIEVSGKNFNNISRPSIPEIQGFRLVNNTPSISRSYRFVNGKSSASYTYTYYLIAEQPGSHNIPPISLSIDGKKRSTGPIQINVKKSNTSSDQSNESSQSGDSNENIFLDMEVSTRTPVPGEQIVASVILYFREGIQVTSYQPVPGWKAEGFWKERLNMEQPETEITVRNGVRYKRAELVEYALFPTHSGTLTLSPYKVAFAVRTRRSGRDAFSSFFGSRQERIELKTDPVQLDVENLPPLKDAKYLGAVGNFEISRSLNIKKAQVGQTVELTTQIRGRGNIPLISKPTYELPKSFETYAPKESSSTNKDGRFIKGKKTFTDVLVPRKTGTFTIPSVKVAYYNPERQDYNVKLLPAIEIDVSRNLAAVSRSQSSGLPIQPVSGAVRWQSSKPTILIYQWWFWVALTLPPIFLLVGYWQKRYREKIRHDRDFARYEHAWKNAQKRLEKARTLSEKKATKEVYSKLYQALTLFISDKLSLSEAGLSDETYIRELKKRQLDTNLIEAIRRILEKCGTIRYAPNPTDQNLKEDIRQTKDIIKKLNKRL